ncbi:MAG TPA: peptidase [Roseburia sp.]|nr:peptidase [Roseburia sp.]
MKKKGFFGYRQYVIAGLLIALAAVGTTALYSSKQEKEREQMEAELAQEMQEQADDVAAGEDSEQSAEASALIPPKQDKNNLENELDDPAVTAELAEEDKNDTTETEDTETSQTAQTAGRAQALHFSEELLWPMEGNVIINYSMDSTVYFPTLDQYKYNPAVIIAGEVNDKVYAVAKGQIKSIENDEVTGCTVTVDLGDGYEAIYGQLKELNFAKGDYVEAGHVLGYIGEPTKYFTVEGSNLYFELDKDGTPVDPVAYFE